MITVKKETPFQPLRVKVITESFSVSEEGALTLLTSAEEPEGTLISSREDLEKILQEISQYNRNSEEVSKITKTRIIKRLFTINS